jgi:hypothetical protein
VTRDAFVAAIRANPAIAAVVDRLPELSVSDAWLTGGCLAQSWWNVAAGRDPQTGIRDYDLFYWDADIGWDAEDRVIRRAATLFDPLGLNVEPRNQARVHLWFESRFGAPCPPLPDARAGIDRFLFPAIRLGIDSTWHLYAPDGLSDTLAVHLRPDPTMPRLEQAAPKAADYRTRFPQLTLSPELERQT